MAPWAERIHATAIALRGRAAIIRGPSGAGKSDLALRCLASPANALVGETAMLVGDDQLIVDTSGGTLRVRAAVNLAGLIEVRGIGVLPISAVTPEAEAALLVDLIDQKEMERLPDPWPYATLAGVRLPVLKLAPFAPSAPIKLLLALNNPQFPDWA